MYRYSILAVCLFFATPAYGWLRRHFEDSIVVARAELMVVGRLKQSSIQKVAHDNGQRGASWEYHTTLIVNHVLKGKLTEKEIPIVIHYGLSPIKGDKSNAIEIYDTGNSSISFQPLVPDALQDHIWFLRKGLRYKNRSASTLPDYFGIVDPEDLQDIKHQDYFQAYLAADPKTAVRDFVATHPEYQKRTASYFTHLEIERILAKPNVTECMAELIPYYADRRAGWDGNDVAAQAFKRHPQEATPELVKLFHQQRSEIPEARGAKGLGQPKREEYCQQGHEQNLRKTILCLLRDMRSPEAVNLCREVLENAHRYWDRIEKFPDTAMTELRYGKENEPKVPLPQDSIYYEVEYAVYAAWASGNNYSRVVPLLIKTHKRWEAKDYGDRRITKATADALLRYIVKYL